MKIRAEKEPKNIMTNKWHKLSSSVVKVTSTAGLSLKGIFLPIYSPMLYGTSIPPESPISKEVKIFPLLFSPRNLLQKIFHFKNCKKMFGINKATAARINNMFAFLSG